MSISQSVSKFLGKALRGFERWSTGPSNRDVRRVQGRVHMGYYYPGGVIATEKEVNPTQLEFESGKSVLTGEASAVKALRCFDNLVGGRLRASPFGPLSSHERSKLLEHALDLQLQGVFAHVAAHPAGQPKVHVRTLQYVHTFTDVATQEKKTQNIATIPLGTLG